MDTPIDPVNHDLHPQAQALIELSLALQEIIQAFAVAHPGTISVFFDGTEVYRQYLADGSVCWWGSDNQLAHASQNSISLVSSHPEFYNGAIC